MDTQKSTMVIARYNENVKIPKGAFVVQKGEHLPNEGRETSSYLWYIINFYEQLPDIVQFRQAKSHEHKIGEFTYKSDLNGMPHHGGLPIKYIADLIELEIPEKLDFTAGAQFDVPRENILLRSKEWYKNAYNISMKEPLSGWVFERLWKYIFNL